MNIINSRYIITIILFFIFVSMKGQERSILYNELHEPVEYANILFYTADTTYIAGSVSDKNGMFQITNKDYSLAKISILGYETRWIAAPLPPTITLHSSPHQLGTIVVKSTSPVKLTGSSLVVNVAGSPYKNLGTANELLGRLPSVMSNEGTYSVFGKGTAAIYINNRKLRDNNELQRLSPNEISKVEIIRNPGAEYDSNIPAVIKIILKRPNAKGCGAQVSTYGRLGREFSDTELVAINYNTSLVDFFFEASNSSIRMNTDQLNNSTIYLNHNLWNMSSDMPGWKSSYYDYALTGGMNFYQSSRHQFGTRWNYTDDTSRYAGFTNNTMLYNGLPFEKLKAQTLSNSGYRQVNGNMYYIGTLNYSFKILFNSDFVGRTAHNNESTLENGEKTPPHTNLNTGTTDYILWSGKLIVKWQACNRLGLSFGMDGYLIDQNRKSHNSDDENIYMQTRLKSQDLNSALFAECNFSLSTLQTNIGLRYETTKMDYRNSFTNEQLLDKTFSHLYPNLSFSLPLGKVNMSLSFTSKVSRPSFYQLRNGSEYFNRYLTTEGNPMLLPQYTDDMSFALQYNTFNAVMGYQRVKNYIQSINIIKEYYPLNVIRRPVNMPAYSGFYLNFSYDKRIGFWHPYLSANITKTYFNIKKENDSAVYEVGKKPFMTFSLGNWFYAGSWIFFADILYSTNGHIREYHKYPQTNVMAGIIKYFFKKSLYISLQANNLLKSKEKETSYNSNEVFWTSKYKDNQTISLRIRYTFRNKIKYKGTSSAQSEIDRM